MSLSRVKVWIPGDILTAGDLNAEFNNLLNNPVSLISPTTGPINFNLQLHTNILPSAITASSGTPGQVLVVNPTGTAVIYGAPSVISATRTSVSGLNALLSSQTATVAADRYIMRTTDNTVIWQVTATSSFGISIGTAGPNAGGRDIAGAFASTYVHWYAISTGITSTAPAGLVSTNPPTVGPVAMPSSYSGWTYLGASPYTSASTTVSSTHRFVRNYAVFPRPQDNEIVTAGASTSIAAVSISSAIPPNSPGYHLRISQSTAAASATVLIDGVSTYFSLSPTLVGTNLYVPKTTDGLAYQMSAAGGALNILLTGYQMPNGDV